MNRELLKFPKTYAKFQKYMAGFYCQDINNLPDQFLAGCLLDFCAKNSKLILTISNGSSNISSICNSEIEDFIYVYGYQKIFIKAFEMMETEK